MKPYQVIQPRWNDSMQRYTQSGAHYLDNGDFETIDEAIEACERLLESEPTWALAILFEGEIEVTYNCEPVHEEDQC